MADYRLYLLDGNGRIQEAHEFLAEDDGEAIVIALDKLAGAPGELWNLARKVRSFRAAGRDPSGSSGSPDQGAPH